MLLTAKFKINSMDFSEVCRPFELAPVTKLLNLNAPQCCIIECCPSRACIYFLFTKITFLTCFLPKLSFYNIIYFSLAAREIGRQADWIGKHFPMSFAFPVQNVIFSLKFNCLHFISYQQIDSFPFVFSFIQQYCQFLATLQALAIPLGPNDWVTDCQEFTIQSDWCCNLRTML